MAVGCLTIAGPMVAGIAAGDIGPGASAAIGGFMMGGLGSPTRAREHRREIALVFAIVVAAIVAAALIAGERHEPLVLVILAGGAALFGGVSRFAAIVAMRFVLFLVLTSFVMIDSGHAASTGIMVALGAAWAGVVNVAISALAPHRPAPPPAQSHPRGQRLKRWRASLKRLAGWQFALRLVACLAAAGAIRAHWPEHHFHWIAITVALLTERSLERFPVRVTQRAVGTLVGVIAAGLVYWLNPPQWALAAVIAVLAAARAPLRTANYLAYTVVQTPLVLLILDAGQRQGFELLGDRLVATLIGAALVLAANELLLLAGASKPAP